MGFKFRKSRRSGKILPGVRLNVGKKGINSVSIGGRGQRFGATTNVNLKTGKTKATYNIKGVGSFEHKPTPPKTNTRSKSVSKPTPQPPRDKAPRNREYSADSLRWYQQDWFAILSILVFPPLGIAAIWFGRWSKPWKITSTVFAVFWTFFLFAGIPPQQPPEPADTSTETEAITEVPNEAPPQSEISTTDTTSWDEVFQEAGRLSETAQGLAENALSPDVWSLIAGRLERSIQLYESIPESNSNYSKAQEAVETLKRQLFYAQKGQTVPADTFPQAINAATKAANLTQTAQSTSDWEEVVTTWQESIELLQLVSEDSPNIETARAKITEYEKNLQYAQAKASAPPPQPAASSQPTVVRAREPRPGSCDCPYDYTSSGSRCGGRSAYSRPGGASPVCYVPAEQ